MSRLPEMFVGTWLVVNARSSRHRPASAVPVIEAAASLARNTDKRAELLDGGEALVRLLRQQHVADDLLARDAVRLGLAVDLRLDQRRVDIARADRVAGDVGFGGLQRGHLGQADDAVLGRDIGRLERRGDEPVRRGDIDDAAELVLAHRRQRQRAWCGTPTTG